MSIKPGQPQTVVHRSSGAYDPERPGPAAVITQGPLFPHEDETVFALTLEPDEALKLWAWLENLSSRDHSNEFVTTFPDVLESNLSVYPGDLEEACRADLSDRKLRDLQYPSGLLLGQDVELREETRLSGVVTQAEVDDLRGSHGRTRAADYAVSPEFVVDSSYTFARGYHLFGIPELRRLLMFYAEPEALLGLVREVLDYDPAGTAAELLGEELVPDVGREPCRKPPARCLSKDMLASLLKEASKEEVRISLQRALRR